MNQWWAIQKSHVDMTIKDQTRPALYGEEVCWAGLPRSADAQHHTWPVSHIQGCLGGQTFMHGHFPSLIKCLFLIQTGLSITCVNLLLQITYICHSWIRGMQEKSIVRNIRVSAKMTPKHDIRVTNKFSHTSLIFTMAVKGVKPVSWHTIKCDRSYDQDCICWLSSPDPFWIGAHITHCSGKFLLKCPLNGDIMLS